jgi:hypothetical protein
MNTPSHIPTPLTYEILMASIYENDRILSEKFAEGDRQRKENERILNEKFAEGDRLRKESEVRFDKEMKKSNENFEKQRKKSNEDFEKRMKKYEDDYQKRMKKMEETMGNWSNNHGSFAEEYFFNSFENEQQNFFGEHFNEIRKKVKPVEINLNREYIEDEYDIVMYNDFYVAIVEVKFKAHKNDIPKVLKKAETFRILCPSFKDFKIYLGLASLSFYDELEQECINQGIAIIKQVGDTVVINDAHLKVF